MNKLTVSQRDILGRALGRSGHHATQARELVYSVLLAQCDHPTAEEIFLRVKAKSSRISLGTVYKTLELLVASGLIRHITFDREPARYCSNLEEHAHFHCNATGRVYDIELPHALKEQLLNILPKGFSVTSLKVNFEGAAANLTTS